jgi:hypothetical protein
MAPVRSPELGLSPHSDPQTTLPTNKGGDRALGVVLDTLTGGVTERADTPNAWVTAVR